MNGKDIRRLIDNASFVFDEFKTILEEGGREKEGCKLSDDNIREVLLRYKTLFLLWDRAFALARTVTQHQRMLLSLRGS